MEHIYIPIINSIHDFLSRFSFLSSHPLFSIIATLYTLILLYAPSFFLRIVLSPVLNSTGIILLFLLKLGANERLEIDSDYSEPVAFDHINKPYEQLTLYSSFVLESTSLEQRFLDMVNRNRKQADFDHDLGLESNSQDEKGEIKMEMNSKQVDAPMDFIEWNMKAPLEIIYEATYEGEEEYDGNEISKVSSDKHVSRLERYPSFSMCYPESETDSSSDDDFSMSKISETDEKMFLEWEDGNREDFIEISVDCYEKKSIKNCHVEENNLIEIDISAMRY